MVSILCTNYQEISRHLSDSSDLLVADEQEDERTPSAQMQDLKIKLSLKLLRQVLAKT